MPDTPALRFRQIHLDFHTSPLIPDVCRDFDADAFAQTLADAHVDSVTCFGKCHHGMSYFDTQVGVRHPALSFDLLGAQIEALHRRGIRAPIYMTCVWDQHMGEAHPDWQQRRRNGELLGGVPGEPSWKWLCLNSPYLEYQEAQTRELLDRYEVDGIFYDIVFQAEPGCYCGFCQASMKRLGLDFLSEEDQRRHTQVVIDTFMTRLTGLIRACRPEATLFYNGRVRQGMGREAGWMSHAEIEALPTGGWGYAYFPFWVRYARHFGLPTMGMTGRFHRSWADFGGLKAPAALKFECGSMLANGAVCSIGDQLHPRGVLDSAVYKVIGEAYADVEAKEPWCAGAQPVTEIALLLPKTGHRNVRDDADEGAAKMLLELHQAFDIRDADADWSHYRLLIIADRGTPTPELTARLRAYLQNGGKLLLSHEALLDPVTGDFALAGEMGVRYTGPCAYQPSFFKLRPDFRGGIRDFEWVLHGGGSEVQPLPGTETLADVYASYFNRTGEHFTSHFYSPRTDPTGAPAITQRGGVVYLYGAFFQDYQTQGDTVYRRMVGNALDRLLPDRLLTTDAPPSTEATVTRQGERHIVHLVNYQPNRRGAHVEVIEEVVPLRDVRVGLRLPAAPSQAYAAPDRTPLDVTYRDGVATVTVPLVREHGMVVFEKLGYRA